MNWLKLGYKSIFAIVGTSLFYTSSVQAWQPKNRELTSHHSENSQLVAEKFRNYCNQDESVFFFAETKDFWVNICGGHAPYHYVGVSKKNTTNSIRLPLNNYSRDGNYYQANNGNVVYEVLMNTAKGSFLLVTQGNKQLVRQPLIYWE